MDIRRSPGKAVSYNVLFPVMRNGLFNETQEVLLRHAVQRLRQLLPSNWQVDLSVDGVGEGQSDFGYDADVIVRSPGGETVFVAQAKATEQGTRSAQYLVNQLRKVAGGGQQPLVVTNYANPALRQVLEDAGVSYLDETGWIYLRSDDTGLLVRQEGAKRAPTSQQRDATMGRLDGPGASAVIRSLWDFSAPIGVRAVASQANVSPGTAAKVLPALARYGAIERSPRGMVTAVDRRLLLERWVQDYGIFTTNPKVFWFLSPRGPDTTAGQLLDRDLRASDSGSSVPVAFTGYLMALSMLPLDTYPVIPHALLSLYTADPELLASSLGLKPATRKTANVVIVQPRDKSLLTSPHVSNVPTVQALADLMTMGGRFPELAEQVLQVVLNDGGPLESYG